MSRAEINVDPVHDEFFKAQDLADTLAREAIQNSLDARRGRATVRVRIRLATGDRALRGEIAARCLRSESTKIYKMPKMGSKMPNMGTQAVKRTGLAGALFTTTQQRVLALLFGHATQSFIQQDLIERAGGGSGAIRRELSRLVESGLVTATLVGKQKHFQANPDAPIFDELRRIIIKTVGLMDPIRVPLQRLAGRIDFALIYGSVARGEDGAQSDIDLMVVAHDLPLEELFARLAPVEKMLGRKINPTLYTRADFERRRRSGNPFLKKVLEREHLLLLGKLDDDGEPR